MNKPLRPQNTLVKIIVNKSHFENRLVEVKSDGHTLLTGENGDGKSTTLSLYGAFYGAEPSKLVDRDAGKLPFRQFYLPQDKSFIAYEYLRAGQPKVAFIYKNGSNGIAYRFVDISAEHLLSQENIDALDKEYESTRDWLTHHIKKQVDVSQPITTTQDYRFVIQGNRRELGKRRNSNGQLLTIAQKYSLCDPKFSMQHIDVLVSTMMRQNQMLQSFKRMITDAFIAPKVSLSKSPYNKADVDAIDALKAIRALDKHKSTFEMALMYSQRMEDVYVEAAVLLNQMVAKREGEVKQQTEILKQLEAAQANQRKFKENAENRRLRLNESLNDINKKLQSIDRDLTAIHRTRERFESTERIQDVIAEREQSNVIRTQHKQALEHLKMLRKGFEAEEERLGVELQRLDNQHLQMAIDISKKVELQTGDLRKHQEATKELMKQAEAQYVQDITDINKQYRELNRQAVLKLNKANIEVERSGSLTPEEKEELESYQSEIDTLQDKVGDAHDSLNEANEKVSSLTQQHHGLLDDINSARKAKTGYQQKIDEIQEVLNPAANTLAAFLNSQVPEWRSTLGKTVNPALLTNTKLSPKWGEDSEYNQHLIHGIELDLSSIQSELAREEEELLDDLRTLEAKIISNTKVEKDLVRQAGDLSNELSACKKHVLLTKDVIKKHGEKISRLRLQLKNKKLTFEEQARKRSEAAAKHAKSCESEVARISEKQDVAITNVSNTHSNTLLQMEADATLRESEIEAAIEALRESLSQDKTVTNQRKSQLKKAHADKLRSDGIDPQVIASARSEVNALEYRIDRIEKSHDLIAEYHTWLNKDWSRVDSLNTEDKDFNGRKMKAEGLIESHAKRKSDGEKQHSDKIARLSQESNQCGTNADALERAATRLKETILPKYLTDEVFPGKVDVQIAIEQSVSLVKQINANRDAIIKSVDKVSEVLGELGPANDISLFWEEVKRKRRLEMEEESPDQVFGGDFKIALLPSLDQLINVVIPEKQSIILEAIRSVSMKYSNFYLTLDDMNKKIRNVSNLLARSVGTSNPFPAIEELQLGVVSKVEKFESWDALVAFHREWDKWAEAAPGSLPSEAFIRAFESAYRSLLLLKLDSNLASLVDLEVSVTENGQRRTVRNDNDLAKVSSEGVSKLALIVLYCGMARFLCPDPNTVIHWPVDELGKISLSNTRLLFNMMSEKGISLVTAEPNYRREMLRYYTNKLHIDRRYGVMTYVDVRKNQNSSRLFSVVNTQQEEESAHV